MSLRANDVESAKGLELASASCCKLQKNWYWPYNQLWQLLSVSWSVRLVNGQDGSNMMGSP